MLFHEKSEVKRLFHPFFIAIFLIIVNHAYLLAEQAAKPTFNFPSGKYRQPIHIIIQSATKNVRIYYTPDGSVPDSNSILYSGPIKILTHSSGDSVTFMADNDPDPGDENTPLTYFSATIKAIAMAKGMDPSPIARADYVLDLVDGYFKIPYTDPPPAGGTKHWLDVYQPHGYENTPVLIFIHGGAWRQGDKNIYMELGNTFAGDYHLTTVVANYQLSSDPWNAVHPTHVQDVALAFDWVYKHIREYGGDPNQIYLFGQSAGGHLVSLLSTDSTYLKTHGHGPDKIRKVISMSGAYNLSDLVKWPMNPLDLGAVDVLSYKALCQNTFGGWEESVLDQASPEKFLTKKQPSFLIIGLNETGEFLDMPGFRRQADNFYNKIKRLSLEAEYKLLNENDIPDKIQAVDFPGDFEGHYEEIYAINTQFWDCPSSQMVASSLPDMPETPVIAEPSKNNMNTYFIAILKWFHTIDADQYEVKIASDSNFLNQLTFTNNVVSDTSVMPNVKLSADDVYYWRVRAKNQSGISAWSLWGKFKVIGSTNDLVNADQNFQNLKLNFKLFPNPFNSALRINIQTSDLSTHYGRLEIFDISGRTVKSERLSLQKGTSQWYWEPMPEIESGVYLLRFSAGRNQEIRRVTYLK